MRVSASRIAVSTRPSFDVTIQRESKSVASKAHPLIAKSAARVPGAVTGKPRIHLKSVKPLLPPKPVALRKKSSIAANVSACVMMEKYTPFTRERKAKKPKTNARIPGTRTTSNAHHQNWSEFHHCQGSSFQSRNTMKSGRSAWYWPSRPICRMRYMPMA